MQLVPVPHVLYSMVSRRVHVCAATLCSRRRCTHLACRGGRCRVRLHFVGCFGARELHAEFRPDRYC